MDAFRFAMDETWRWAERRGVRVDFWRNENQDWEVMVVLHDLQGDFTATMAMPLYHPSKAERRKYTVEELRAAYIKQLRSLLDGMTASARLERGEWQKRRLQ